VPYYAPVIGGLLGKMFMLSLQLRLHSADKNIESDVVDFKCNSPTNGNLFSRVLDLISYFKNKAVTVHMSQRADVICLASLHGARTHRSPFIYRIDN